MKFDDIFEVLIERLKPCRVIHLADSTSFKTIFRSYVTAIINLMSNVLPPPIAKTHKKYAYEAVKDNIGIALGQGDIYLHVPEDVTLFCEGFAIAYNISETGKHFYIIPSYTKIGLSRVIRYSLNPTLIIMLIYNTPYLAHYFSQLDLVREMCFQSVELRRLQAFEFLKMKEESAKFMGKLLLTGLNKYGNKDATDIYEDILHKIDMFLFKKGIRMRRVKREARFGGIKLHIEYVEIA